MVEVLSKSEWKGKTVALKSHEGGEVYPTETSRYLSDFHIASGFVNKCRKQLIHGISGVRCSLSR